MSKRQFRLAPVAAAVLALTTGSVHAQWKVQPGVQVRELYSDNPAMQADPQLEGQFITELAPSLTVVHAGPRLDLAALFRMSGYAYSKERPEGTNRSSHEAQISAQATLLDDLLYFTGQGASAPRAMSPFGQPLGNSYASVNREQVTSYSLGPYLQHRFSGGTTALLRVSHDYVNISAVGVGSSDSNNVLLNINSDEQRHALSWGVQYSRQKLSGSEVEDSNTEELSTTLRYRAIRSLSLRVGAGYDKYDFSPLGGTTEGRSWNLGFNWVPSARTSVDASYGRRFVGAVKSLQASHRSRQTVWSLTYDDSVTTTRGNFLLPAAVDTASMLDRLFTARISDPLQRRQAVDDYIRLAGLPATLADSINYFSNRYFLQKQLRGSVALTGARSSALLSLYRTRRDALSTSQSDSVLLGSSSSLVDDNIIQRGASLALTYRLGARSTATLTEDVARAQAISNGFSSTNHISRLNFTRTIARNAYASLELRHSSGSFGSGASARFRENALIAALTYQK